MAEPVTVVVIEDHAMFRAGIRELLEHEQIQILGEASTGEAGLELVARLKPDVAIVDLSLPGISGVEVTRRITTVGPAGRPASTRVLILTVSDSEADVRDAVLAGACGYLLKDALVDQIVAGVRAAAADEAMISTRMTSTLLARLRELEARQDPPPPEELSTREREVLRLVAEGKGNAEIAEELFISLFTVKNHLSHILEKLHVDNRIQAAVRAVRESMI
jgi:DNA-binding NarL/FixJ family response regulator